MLQALSGAICPDTVLLFKPRMSYPALRVTRINFHLKISVFFSFSLKFSMKFIENQIFSNFSFFSKNVQNFVPTFDAAIIYRPRRYLAQNHRWKPTLSGNKLRSKFERMEQSQKFTFALKRSRFVASPLNYDLPWHRITLRA